MTESLETLSQLICKRHQGDGWFLFHELADKPGFYAKRFADHAALGVWGSTQYEFHLYETKISREDVKREMRDPTKVDGVGKYAHRWWLVIPDPKIIADVVIPEVWGVLTPTVRGGSRMLTVVPGHKGKKLAAKPFSVQFCVSLLRNMASRWVKPEKIRELQERVHKLEHPDEVELSTKQELTDTRLELTRLRASVEAFQKESGIDLSDVLRGGHYRARELGKAVRVAQSFQLETGPEVLRTEMERMVSVAADFHRFADDLATRVAAWRDLLPPDITHARRCAKVSAQFASAQKCTCGVEMSEVERKLRPDVRDEAPVVAAGNDDQGGGGHRGRAREDVQDAGAIVRDLGDAVPHGQ